MASRRGRRSACLAALLICALGLPVAPLQASVPTGGAPGTDAVGRPVSVPAFAKDPSRLDARLRRLAAAASAGADARALRPLADEADVRLIGRTVTVAIQSEDGRVAAERAVAAAGGSVTGALGDLVRADVPVVSLRGLAQAPGVVRVRPPLRPIADATLPVSEGVRIAGASGWHSTGITGAGVKVGIIDTGFRGYATLLGTYLPATVETYPASAPPADESPHGCAVAEVVHDVAPGAALYLARVGDEFDLAGAYAWLHGKGVSVVNMSLGFVGQPLDGGRTPGQNSVDSVVSQAVADGTFWANAAGNLRRRHWRGNFTDRDADTALDWSAPHTNLNTFRYTGGAIHGVLWWRDSWTKAVDDYDLVLLHYDPDMPNVNGGRGGFETIADPATESSDAQWGRTGDRPFEEVHWTGGTVGDYYAWAVVNARPRPLSATSLHGALSADRTAVDFDFFCPEQDILVSRPDRSIATPADNESDGFMAVAAIQSSWGWAVANAGFGRQERWFSSEGPNQNGRHTVQIAAPDGVANHVAQLAPPAGLGGVFAGTSASSPHVAGAAALLRQRYGYSATQTAAALRAGAIDLGTPGLDDQTGWGALRLPDLTPPPVSVGRLAGTDRYLTAIAASRATFADGAAPIVVLATGEGFADAISGAGLAGSYGGPLLLTRPDRLTPALTAELHRLGASEVLVLGGTPSVSAAVVQQLSAAGFSTSRLGGRTRYDTAARIARLIASREGTSFAHEAFVVNGTAFPDAMAAAPYAYRMKLPVLPVERAILPPVVASAIASIGVTTAVVVGNADAVSESVHAALDARGVATVSRAGGVDRYDTGRAVAAYATGRGWADWGWVGVASGANYPDALGGAAAVGAKHGVLVLSPPEGLSTYAKTAIEAAAKTGAIHDVRLFGSGSALQGAVLLGARVLTDQ